MLALLTVGCDGRLVEIRGTGEVELERSVVTGTILAADGSVLRELHAVEDRRLVPIGRVPAVLRDAVVATEDARFYSHGGVDARAVARALVQNVREGRVAEGGSTITQQLAKVVTGSEQTLDRKLAESSVAIQLEQRYSKDEILERYLNTVYFGNGAYGVQTAARTYFGVDVELITLPQAALLAGLIAAPSAYDPYRSPEPARARRDLVLRRMVAQRLVTEEAAESARTAQLALAPPHPEESRAPWFTDHVLDVLYHDPALAALGADPVERADRLFRDGLIVETTLDAAWQTSAEEALAATLTAPDDPHGALVALDPVTGEIRALVGGRDYDDPDDPVARFDLATDGLRQPGSAMKPIVLATALAKGHTLDEVFPAPEQLLIPIPGSTGPWNVSNYEGTDFGALSLRDATRFSVNTVYAQLMAEVGPEAVAATARAMGIERDLLPLYSLALGAQEVSVLDMASVQATLATGGLHHPPSAVRRVLDRDGEVLWERGAPVADRVLDERVAWQTTQALEGVVRGGTGTGAYLGRPTAGQTGTTQDTADAWVAGFTPDLAVAVWVGFPRGRVPMEPPRTRILVEGGTWPAEIFARFGLRALASVPAHAFPIPEGEVATVTVDVTRDCLPNPYTPPELIDERGYLPGTEPTAVCAEPSGPPVIDVPAVVGQPRDAALAVLAEAGLRAEVVEAPSAQYPPGIVAAQSPDAGPGRQTEDGYVVTLTVASSEVAQVTVPDVLGQGVEQARAALEGAGLAVGVTQLCPGGGVRCTGATERPGLVWEQLPDAGAVVPARTAVRLSAYPG